MFSCNGGTINVLFYDTLCRLTRLPKIIGLFCKKALQKRLYSAKETCTFKKRGQLMCYFMILYADSLIEWLVNFNLLTHGLTYLLTQLFYLFIDYFCIIMYWLICFTYWYYDELWNISVHEWKLTDSIHVCHDSFTNLLQSRIGPFIESLVVWLIVLTDMGWLRVGSLKL